MAASAADIASVRRMTAETAADSSYASTDIARIIERYPLQYTDPTTGIRYPAGSIGWVAGYDLNRAAADIWEEKAAAVADQFAYSELDSSYHPEQLREQYERTAQMYRRRARPRAIGIAS